MSKGSISSTPPMLSHQITNVQFSPEQLLSQLLVTPHEVKAQARLRRERHNYKSIPLSEENAAISDGWELARRGKASLRMRKKKPSTQALQDRFWSILQRMGYPVLNSGCITINYEENGEHKEKIINVLAKDDETILVIECEALEERNRANIGGKIKSLLSLQKHIANTLKSALSMTTSPKILWIYSTTNIIWSENDIEAASAANIRVVTENELKYYEAFAKHIGPAARFQFLAEFLKGQSIPGLENIKVPAIRGTLGGNLFYSFVTTPRHLLKIAFVNHQALSIPGAQPAYQRMINPDRTKDISRYIQQGGYFPTNMLINFTEKCRFDFLPSKENTDPFTQFGILYLPSKYKSAWIIDGQHRLYGFSHLSDDYLDQSIFVIAFERMKTKTEADLFVTINSKQKAVPNSIIVSLKADLKWGSSEPKERIEALGSALVKGLNSDPTSPLFQRFAADGIEDNDAVALTISEFVKGITRSGLLGRVINKNYALGPLCGPTDDESLKRSRKFINSYFHIIQEANPQRWEKGREAYILTNPGVRAHLLLISEAIRYLSKTQGIDPALDGDAKLIRSITEIIAPVCDYIRHSPDESIRSRLSKKFGDGGITDYYYTLAGLVASKAPSFGGDELRGYMARTNETRMNATHQLVIQLSKDITDHVFNILKRVHGEHTLSSGQKAYWVIGVESQSAKTAAYERQQSEAADAQLPIEAYVDIIDLMKIVRQKNNWEHFKGTMNLQIPEETKGKVYYLDWMERFNKLRRIPAHSSSLRVYTEDDYQFIEWLEHEFYSRIAALGAP